MSQVDIDAVVLRHVDYADSDRIITLFSRERGRVEGRARGVRKSQKRFAGQLDLFTRVRLSLREGRGAPHLEGAEVMEAFMGLRADLDRLAWAGALAELCMKLYGEGEAHPTAFDVLVLALDHLAAPAEPNEGLLHVLELRLLEEAGLKPTLDRCVGCGKQVGSGPRFVFHVARGGVLCDSCVGADSGLRVDAGTLKLLDRGLQLAPEAAQRLRFNEASLAQARMLIGAFLRYHVGEGWRARRFLSDLKGWTATTGGQPS